MKLFCFYLVIIDKSVLKVYDGILDDRVCNIDGFQYTLYGFTIDSDIRDEFKRVRDMTKFVEKEFPISEDKYMEFLTDNKEFEISHHQYITKNIKRGLFKTTNVDIISTEFEYTIASIYCDDTFYSDFILKNMNKDSEIYCKLIDVLNDDVRFSLYDILRFDTFIPHSYPSDEMDDPKIKVDELSLFINLFKQTLK